MLSIGSILIIALVVSLLFLGCLYAIQRRTGNAGIVDFGWSATLGILAILYAILAAGDPLRRLVLGLIAGGWSLRLSWYLLKDRVLVPQEDGRYQTLRQHWGERAQRMLFGFFMAQGGLDVILSLSFLAVALNPQPFGSVTDWLAIGLFFIALGGESLADRQLAAFRREPSNHGKTCRVGLWRTSRHPNYFFEWLHWWVYVGLAIGSPHAWLAWPAPFLMLYFILYVTGIPPTEAQALASRGEDYRAYQKTTSAFFPWFPKKV
ncbi:MAG: DUF1295 domain-containing protein [bacterium]|nr:DUF1295 domain-containing protein [bacterium]